MSTQARPTPHILFVEDNHLFRQMVGAALDKAGFHVTCVDNAEAAFELLIEQQPDLVIADVFLSGELDGFGLCHRIRSLRGFENMPLIILSALSGVRDLAAAKIYGADDYLTKPVNLILLVERVRGLLHRRRQRTARSTWCPTMTPSL